jgi:hypothetical protein
MNAKELSMIKCQHWSTVLATAGLFAGTLVLTGPALQAQAATTPPTCDQNANMQGYIWEDPGNWGATEQWTSAFGVLIALQSGYVHWAGGGDAPSQVGWALLVGDTREVSVDEKVKIQISTDGGRTVAQDCGWHDSYWSESDRARIATSYFWLTESDPNYRFRACGWINVYPGIFEPKCTSWW